MSKHADYYPEHDRTSCDDEHVVNAEAGGSRGCARCTALLLDQRDELLEALCNALPYVEDVLANKEQLACFKPGVVQAHAKAIRAAIAKTEGRA